LVSRSGKIRTSVMRREDASHFSFGLQAAGGQFVS
jgi:hypothetical protein